MTTNKAIVFWIFIGLFIFDWWAVVIAAIILALGMRALDWVVKDIDDTGIN